MKKFKLDLTAYDVTVRVAGKDEKLVESYPLRDNISVWLRSIGVFKSAEDIAEAVVLAKRIRECEDNAIELDEREVDVLRQAVNKQLILTAEGRANLGGPIHEEAIIRVAKMEEVK